MFALLRGTAVLVLGVPLTVLMFAVCTSFLQPGLPWHQTPPASKPEP
jgi:hypothetical protein